MAISKLKSELKKDYIFLKKVLIFYLMITQTIIECTINIYPDHHSEDDPNFQRSQVKKITNESFYYDLGYFTQRTDKYRSPKYGLNYRPVKCEKMSEDVPDPVYKSDDDVSFFGDGKGIENRYSTINNLKNKFEETKLFRNTITGYNFTCPSPIRSFHNESFEINFTIPMIATSAMQIDVRLVSEDGAVNNSIGLVDLQPNVYKKVTFFIFPQEKDIYNTSKMIFKFERDGTPNFEPPLSIVGDPDLSIQFVSQEAGDLTLSNYRVTITDIITITGTPFDINYMIRSKNGLPNNCTKDEDCFIGFMCSHFNCTPCHTTCTECYQDDFNPAGMNYCRECNVLSRNIYPRDGYCDIGYVDMSLFKDFDVKVKVDGQDFNDRETLGFWIFFSDTELSRDRDNPITDTNYPRKRERALKPEPEPEDILHHIVLKDRFVITLIQRVRKFSVYCHVYENLFSRNTTDHLYFNQSQITKINGRTYTPKREIFRKGERFFYPHPYYYKNLSVPSDKQKEFIVGNTVDQDNEFDKTIDGHWVHVSCAESFDHGLYYLKTVINGQMEYNEDHLYHEPLNRTFENGEFVKINVENDKYFKPIIYDDNVLYLQFLNFNYSDSKIYLRHLTLFKEYIPINMQYMYFDYSNVKDFYELLYYIPFTELIYGNNRYRIKGYAYEYEEQNIYLELNSTNENEIIGDVSPPLNFMHLNFPPVNKRYIEIDLLPNETTFFSKSEDMKYVYDDDSPMSCKFYLDTNKGECLDRCIDIRKLPYIGVNDKSGYCDYTCSDSMSCLKDQPTGEELDYNGGFCTHLSKAYNLFYRCEDDQIDYYFQFSGFYNSSKMEKKIPKMYSYMIDFWYYNDYSLTQLREKYFGYPPHEKHYILHTNVIDLFHFINVTDMYYLKENPNNDKSKKIGYAYYNHTLYFSLKDSFDKLIYRFQEWNRFFIYTRYNRTVEKYQMTICLNYYNVETRPKETGYCRGLTELYPTIGALENIIFCDKVCKDWESKTIHWSTGYYKNFRIWDGNNVSPRILAQYDNFYPSYTYRVSAIKYYFPMTNKYMSNNKVFDPKNEEAFEIEAGKYKFRKHNYSSKFDMIATQKLLGSCFLMNYEILYIEGNEIFEILPCKEGCERCWCTEDFQDRCFKCREGYYLNEEYFCHRIGAHYFKSPNLLNKDLDAKISKVTLIENQPAVTITFWFKTFGFAGDDHIVLFTIGDYLEVVFSSSDKDPIRPYGLSIVNDNRLVSNVFGFREMIGDWLFFSLAYHREMSDFGINYFPAMMKFELAITPYEVNITNVKKDMSLHSFSIKKDYFGLFADLKFYSQYIIGQYANDIDKQLHEPIVLTPFYYPVPVESYFAPGRNNKACFQTSYLTGANINDFECVPDEGLSHNYYGITYCNNTFKNIVGREKETKLYNESFINKDNKMCFNECYKFGNTTNE